MRFAVRAAIFVLFFVSIAFIPTIAFASAQEQQTYPASQYTENTAYPPNVAANVPLTQNTRVQTLLIDLLSSVSCIVTGIDPLHKNNSCLGVNPQTGQIGYVPQKYNDNGQPVVGGLLGTSTAMIAVLYTPSVSTGDYTNYLAQNFGIVKPAHAQVDQTGYGFTSLTPVLQLWTAMRNMAYFLLMVAFVIIGLGIMLRAKADPRTTMSIQNQIPRIVICILLVTFSYGIAGLMIDMMWLSTYVGINIITQAGPNTNPSVPIDDNNAVQMPLSQAATQTLLQTPITYVNQVFRRTDSGQATGDTNVDSGIGHITDEVSYSLGSIIENLVSDFFGSKATDPCVRGILPPDLDWGACFGNIAFALSTVLLWLIIVFMLLKLLFSVWVTLLKAYVWVILYTIAAPFFIVMGLLPGKPLGFEKWLRALFANLAVFPVTAFIFVLGRLFIELFNQAGPEQFVPPLVGQPNIVGYLGVLMAFGLLLISPTMLATLQEALKAKGNPLAGGAIGNFTQAGAAVPKAVMGNMWQRAVRKRNLSTGEGAGWLRSWGAGRKAPDPNAGAVTNFFRKLRMKLDPLGKGGGGGGKH